jgi:hypothetical protein
MRGPQHVPTENATKKQVIESQAASTSNAGRAKSICGPFHSARAILPEIHCPTEPPFATTRSLVALPRYPQTKPHDNESTDQTTSKGETGAIRRAFLAVIGVGCLAAFMAVTYLGARHRSVSTEELHDRMRQLEPKMEAERELRKWVEISKQEQEQERKRYRQEEEEKRKQRACSHHWMEGPIGGGVICTKCGKRESLWNTKVDETEKNGRSGPGR